MYLMEVSWSVLHCKHLIPPWSEGRFLHQCGLKPSLGVVVQVKIPYLWNQALVIQFRLQEITVLHINILSNFDVAAIQGIFAVMFYTLHHRSSTQAMLIILHESKSYEFDDALSLLSFRDVMPCSLIEIY